MVTSLPSSPVLPRPIVSWGCAVRIDVVASESTKALPLSLSSEFTRDSSVTNDFIGRLFKEIRLPGNFSP